MYINASYIISYSSILGQIIELLHQYGANINERDAIYGETPLHKCTKSKNIMINNFK